jgi:hypothetical protein
MTFDFRTDLNFEHFLNHLIDQIIKINAQSIQIIQTEQKRSVDFYYMKVNDLNRDIQLNEL